MVPKQLIQLKLSEFHWVICYKKLLKELVYDCDKKKLNVIDTKTFLGKENKRMVPTNVGTISNKFLVTNFPQIMDVGFTANMEKELDDARYKLTFSKREGLIMCPSLHIDFL